MFRGEAFDFTRGSLPRAMVLLAVPMVLEMLMQSVFSIVDVYFVSRLGPDAVAAVGLTDSVLVLVLAVGMGLSMATTALVARRIGEGDPEAATRAAGQALIVGAVIAVPITLLGVFGAEAMLRLMGASPEVVAVGAGYCRVTFAANGTILFLFLINAIFRGAGDAVMAMRALWLANVLNIVLDPALIFGWGFFPEMGVTGAAVATALGRGAGILFQLFILVGGRGRIHLSAAALRFDRAMLARMVRIAGPGMVQYVVGTASWLAVIRLVASFGSDALAGYTIAVRILVFALLPSWGMGNAAATLVGQNLGARQPERAARSVWLTAGANAAFLGVVAVGLIVFAEPLIRLFTDAPAVVAFGVSCLRIVACTYVFFAFGVVCVQAFNGAGDTTTPTWISLVANWALQIPLAYLLAVPFEMGPAGVFTAIAFAQMVLAVIAVVLFRRGAWKTRTV